MREYSVAEVAARLKRTSTRVYQLIKEGHIQTVRRGRTGRWVRITEQELKRYEQLKESWDPHHEATQ